MSDIDPRREDDVLEQEIDTEENPDEPEIVIEKVPDDDESEAVEEDTEEDDEESETDESRKPRQSRAQKRIRQLVAGNKALRSRLAELENRFADIDTRTVASNEEARLAEAEYQLNNAVAQLEQEWEKAYENDDRKKLFEVQKAMSAVQVQKSQIDQYKALKSQGFITDQPQGAHVPPRAPDEKAVSWARKNQEWFGRDEKMTRHAYAIHAELQDEGEVELGSDEYYKELDIRMREDFPALKGSPRTSRRQVRSSVAGPSGTRGAKGRVSVKLSPREMGVADRLGISYEAYAKQKLNTEGEIG